MMDVSRKNREPLFDIIKALMMIWVVWGHLGRYGIVPPYSNHLPYMANAKIGVVYVIHEWIMMKAGANFSILPLPEWSRWPIAIGYFLICHYIIIGIKSNIYTKMLFFGNERWLSNFFKWVVSSGRAK